MFRIDSEHVVDASCNGGLARYNEIALVVSRHFISEGRLCCWLGFVDAIPAIFIYSRVFHCKTFDLYCYHVLLNVYLSVIYVSV